MNIISTLGSTLKQNLKIELKKKQEYTKAKQQVQFMQMSTKK